MTMTKTEAYGKLLLSQLFTNIWLGEWDKYEQTISQLPNEITDHLPFHSHYVPREVKLAHENYFIIPGEFFIPPYVSAYYGKSEEEQQVARQDLLCLVGAYEKVGYYYPVEIDELPDHIGSIIGFITALLQEEIKAADQNDPKVNASIKKLQQEVYEDYLRPALNKMKNPLEKTIDDSFFKYFLPYFNETMEMIIYS